MPFCVRPISPARKALLLLVSSQESVPGMKVSYSAWAYFSASTVSGLSITTWSFSSTSLPPCDHTTQVHQALPSPTALPSAKPGGCPLSLSLRQSSRKPCGSDRHAVVAGLVDPGLAVDDPAARGADRHADPAAVLGAVLLGHRPPAAVLLAEIGGQLRQIEHLVGELVGIVRPRHHDVGAAADIAPRSRSAGAGPPSRRSRPGRRPRSRR